MIILLLVAGTALPGQEIVTEKPKRWHLSNHLGLDTYPVNAAGNGSKGSKLLLTELNYRLHRHLDAGAQLGYQREWWSGFNSLDAAGGDPVLARVAWNGREHNFFLGLQAKLNFRIGQGDLSLSGSYGLVRHSYLVRASNAAQLQAQFKMLPLTDTYTDFTLGYTYWANAKFGLMIGFNVLKMNHGVRSRNVDYLSGNVPRYVISEMSVEGAELTENDLLGFRKLIDATSRHYLTVGLVTKLF